MANIQTAHGHVTLDALQQQARIRVGISVALGALMFFGGIGLVEFLRLPDNLGEGAAPPTATAAAPSLAPSDDEPPAVAVTPTNGSDPARPGGSVPPAKPRGHDPILLPEGDERGAVLPGSSNTAEDTPSQPKADPRAEQQHDDDVATAKNDPPSGDDTDNNTVDNGNDDGNDDNGNDDIGSDDNGNDDITANGNDDILGIDNVIDTVPSTPAPTSGPWWERCRDRACRLEFGPHQRIVMREGHLTADRQTGYRPFRYNDVVLRLDRDTDMVIVAHFYGMHSRTKEPTLVYATVKRSGRDDIKGIIPLRLGSVHLQMNPIE